MAIACIILAAFLGYSTSKYFPEDISFSILKKLSSPVKKGISAVLYCTALVFFILDYGSATGSIMWLVTVTLVLSLYILALPYQSKLVYVFWIAGSIFLIFDILHYYAS